MTICKYVLCRLDGTEEDYEFDDYRQALNEARGRCGSNRVAIIEREYEYSDSGLVWTPDGGSCWPPKEKL